MRLFCSRKGDIQWNVKTAELLPPAQVMFALFRGELRKDGHSIPVPKLTPLLVEKFDEAPGVRPMPLRVDEPGIGEDVYALGSPLGDTFNTTLTRGILSGVRVLKDQEFLQSDVAILPGSSGGPLLDKSGQVVGITVAGLGAKGLAGMNFFIPLASAIDKLNLQLQSPGVKKAQ
ncbi:trypsin-like peptidase domain-containing protein [Herbaspirillum sp. NPDC087042]|uniref:trypsin-like peptidase domain-containing protein n=1 Tax=Herbaspirillum sp. NPDC087042 TaxID=3364004 RepID=UPI0037F4352E